MNRIYINRKIIITIIVIWNSKTNMTRINLLSLRQTTRCGAVPDDGVRFWTRKQYEVILFSAKPRVNDSNDNKTHKWQDAKWQNALQWAWQRFRSIRQSRDYRRTSGATLYIRNLVQNDIFDIVARPKDSKVIKCRTILRNTYSVDRNINRKKARVLQNGSFNVRVDFFETFDPVARLAGLFNYSLGFGHKVWSKSIAAWCQNHLFKWKGWNPHANVRTIL